MSRWPRFVPVLAVAVLLAACGNGGPDNPLAPAPAARFDDGGWTVGGNLTDPPSDAQTTTSSEPPTPPPALPGDTTTRSGGWTVGGN